MPSAIHQVRILPQGESFECPAHKPILVAAHAANILISYSCRSGQCGSCLGKLLSGEVVYPAGQPPALSAEQANSGFALFCSAFARSDLDIELLAPNFGLDQD